MIKLRNAVLAVATGLLATGALAQAHFTQDRESVTVAEELFGSGSVKLEFAEFVDASTPFVPKAKLIFGGATGIAADTEFSVTYTLHNATFAEPVSNADFMWGTWGPDPDGPDGDAAEPDDNNTSLLFTAAPAEVTIEREGGGRGTDSVTFTVTVGDAIPELATPMLNDATPPVYTQTTRKIVFLVPDVNAAGLRPAGTYHAADPGAQVRVATTIAQTKSGGTVIMEGIEDGNMCGTDVLHMSADVTVACPVVVAAAVIESIANTAGSGLISLAPADERAVLVGGDGKASDPQRMHVARVQVTVAEGFGGARDQDGDPIEGFTGDLAGSLAIRVASDGFNEGDVVYIDTNGNKKVDGREAFDMDEGVASDTVGLSSAAMDVYYVPNGKDALKHRTAFTTTANTEFADTTAKMRSAKAATASLKLHGIKDGVAKAYAIAPLTSTDTANVRVTCETSAKAGCNVFLDCKDQMGESTFGEAGATVGPGMTVRWSQTDVAEALGLGDGWEGRMACDVLSSEAITVQVLTRSAGVLVNNTAISEGGR